MRDLDDFRNSLGALRRHLARAALLVVCSVSFGGTGMAADLEVRVFHGKPEQPLGGASVCVGAPGNPAQFGAKRAGRDGSVSFSDVPSMSVVLTVSKPGYRGDRRSVRMQTIDRVMLVRLPTGGGGPECDAQVATSGQSFSGPDQLWISGFRINNGAARSGAREVRLSFAAQGDPTQYRASENPEFDGAEWKPIVKNPSFTLSSGRGSKTVYLQVRRHRELDGATLHSTSNVVADTISLQQ